MQGCIERFALKPDLKQLGVALLASAASALGVAFLAGCFYPYLIRALSGRSVRLSNGDASPMLLLDFGFITALIALPAVFALTLGVGFPLFRHWIQRGYSGVAVYVAGGVIVALIGASILIAAHTLGGFLLDSDFLFAMLIIGVCGPLAGFVVWYVLQRSSQQQQPAK
jgi:hypothetical protein